MGIYDATERLIDVAVANLEKDWSDAAAARDVQVPARLKFYGRVPAIEFGPGADDGELPGYGIFAVQAQAGAAMVNRREWNVAIMFDALLEGPDADLLSKQTELLADAILRVIDRSPEISTTPPGGVREAGGFPGSVLVELTGAARVKGGGDNYQDQVRVTVPVIERDEVT